MKFHVHAASLMMRRRLVGVAVVLCLSTALSALFVTPALAADPPSQTICTAYTDGQILQTTTNWGRARQQLCVQYTTGQTPNQVRALVQFQIDWPTSCSLSVGVPPSAGVSCPLGATMKRNIVSLRELDFNIQWQFGGALWSSSCSFPSASVDNLSGRPSTWSCFGNWEDIFPGDRQHLVTVSPIRVDLKDDGDGLKEFPAESHDFGVIPA